MLMHYPYQFTGLKEKAVWFNSGLGIERRFSACLMVSHQM